MDGTLAAGNRFIASNARLLEQRLHAACFLGGPADGVVDVLRGYQNGDGGFGHGLEPDKRCPASLPIDVEVALGAMATAGAIDATMVQRACDFLARTAAGVDTGGAVPLAFPVIEAYPRAEHWTDWTYEPALNPTAGLVGLLFQLGVDHPWMHEATSWCWAKLEGGDALPDVHTLSELLIFLANVPERDRAAEHAARLSKNFGHVRLLNLDPEASDYGLTPLHLARTPDSPWRAWFSDDLVAAHLDRLERDQQADGGWPISWEPPSPASALEWRGVATLRALLTLRSYGRLRDD
jgi:hypothetical protein